MTARALAFDESASASASAMTNSERQSPSAEEFMLQVMQPAPQQGIDLADLSEHEREQVFAQHPELKEQWINKQLSECEPVSQ
jgi:hypothetical protein